MTRHRLLRQYGSRPGAVLFAMLLFAVIPALAQQAPRTPIFRAATRSVNGGQMELLSTNRALSLDVNIAAFRQAAAPVMAISDVPLAPGLSVDLELEEWNIIEPGAHMVFGTAEGEVPIRLTARLYRGTVKGDPKSDVFISFSDKGVLGHVRTSDKSYEISTDYTAKQDGPVVAAISYPTDALPNKMVNCGVTEENLSELISPNFYDTFEKLQSGHELAADQIEFAVVGAWEADVEYLALFNGDEQAAADYLTQLIGDVSSVYERDVAAQLTIGYMKIWTSSAGDYPYKETANMSIALRETRDYWRQHDEVKRSFVHTFSGKGWVNPIGISFLDVLCDNGRAGSFSAITRTDAARDRRVVAHEIGHNFGSPHTHDCSWPIEGGPGAIDHCAPAEGGKCFSTVEQSVGTIMSYCTQSNLEFHPLTVERMRARLAASSCEGGISSARKLLIQPNLIIFADVQEGQPRDTTFSTFFSNVGFGEINVTGVTQSGEHVDQFEILEGGDVPFTLGPSGTPSATKQIKVRYKAETTEPATLKLTYEHDGFNPPVEITFEGYATNATPVLAFVGADEDEIDWGKRYQGLPNDTTIKVGNFGTGSAATPATLYVTETRIEGRDKLDFQIIDGSAPFQLLGGKQIEVGLRFKAGSTGDKEAELVVVSNSNGEQGHISRLPLYGNSQVGPVMQLGAHDLVVDFGDVAQGADAIEKRFEDFFKNVGGALLAYSANLVTTEGEPNVLTSSNFGFGTELEPGVGYDLVVTFDPKPSGVNAAPGLKRGYLWVESTDEFGDFIISNDTVQIVGNIVTPSAVPDDMQPDEFFYVTTNPTTGADLSFYLAPRDAERNDLYILSVLDLQGKEVYRQVERFGEQGTFHHLDARNWASGVYYVRVSTTQGIRGRKATITR